jgi:hypothetical protein
MSELQSGPGSGDPLRLSAQSCSTTLKSELLILSPPPS